MTTNTSHAEDHLAKLGIHLPDAPVALIISVVLLAAGAAIAFGVRVRR
jgi:hypothetical protein